MRKAYVIVFSIVVAIAIGLVAAWAGSLIDPLSHVELAASAVTTAVVLLLVPIVMQGFARYASQTRLIPNNIMFRAVPQK